jgi:predicted transcriptional regulator
MAQPLIEMAKDLALALVKNHHLEPDDLQQHLQRIHASLYELQAREDRNLGSKADGKEETSSRPPATTWKKSIKKHTIQCLICGETFKQLSIRHLRQHNLDSRTYRQQFAIPPTQPLSAKETTAVRRRAAQVSRPWEQAPAYRKAHQPASPAEKTGMTSKSS